jgi:MEDS: MEthanogen/methylotroph, DcmR Sensory domain/Histidine kinase-like ATPase domain
MAVDTEVRLELGEHVVQFYERDLDLVTTVSAHLTDALGAGDVAVVVATPAHRRAFLSAMSAAGVDVDTAQSSSTLVVADAAETLAAFLVDGAPDTAAFDQVIGGLVQSAGSGGRRVRVYGEMVALLWEDGQVASAIELEELWNKLGDRVPFSLFCAYPAELVSGDDQAEALADVCHLHSTVMGAGHGVEEADQRFERSTRAPRQARHFVMDRLHAWGRDDVVDDAAFVVTELATNAVLHAESDFHVAITQRNGVVRIAVTDSSRTEPRRSDLGLAASCGRGLALIDALATSWGFNLVDHGKQVWAELTP